MIRRKFLTQNSQSIPIYTGTCGDNLVWTLENEILTISGTGSIYDSTDQKSIWIQYKSIIKSIIVEEGVTTLGKYCFSKLKPVEINLPKTLTNIKEYAFEALALETLIIPNSVVNIAYNAFYACKIDYLNLEDGSKNLNIGVYKTNVGDYCTVFDTADLISVYVGRNIYCSSDYVRWVFYKINVYIGENVSRFTASFALSCTVDRIYSPISFIGLAAFRESTFVNSEISLSSTITTIPQGAFESTNIKHITIPESVTSIGKSAFYGCSSLTSITIPESVTWIGYNAFHGTTWYNNQPDGVIYAGKVLYAYKGDMPANTTINVNEGTVSITGKAFEECVGLTQIIIPNSVISIEYIAFYGCTNLTDINIPKSITTIGKGVFDLCYSLKSVTFEDGDVELSIGNSDRSGANTSGLFYYCPLEYVYLGRNLSYSIVSTGNGPFQNKTQLTTLIIGDKVTYIGNKAFNGCTGITSITCKALTPPNIKSYAFNNVDTTIPLYVPSESINTYAETSIWANFTNIQAIPLNLITFAINGTEYYAEDGMTWEQWVESEYNTLPFYTHTGSSRIYTSPLENNGDVMISYAVVLINSTPVTLVDVITENCAYSTGLPPGRPKTVN